MRDTIRQQALLYSYHDAQRVADRFFSYYHHLSEVYNNGNLQKIKKGDLLGRVGGEVRPRCEDPERQRRAALLSVHGSFPLDLATETE